MRNDSEMPNFDDVLAARAQIADFAVRTPLLESPDLNEKTGGRVLIKPECLQRTGSFKFRGAWNRISRLDDAARRSGVVAYSSGNHAQGVAAAARIRDVPALIVMPEDTPEIKKANTRKLGAEVVTYDRGTENREEIAGEIARKRGAVIVPPYEHQHIIAGQGTVGAELAEDAAGRGTELDLVLVCVGGGGLTAGVALALEAMSPKTDVFCVEPEGFDDYARSIASGTRQANERVSGSICDALLSRMPGELTFAINQPRLKGGLTVSDEEVKAAMRYAFSTLKIVVEPGGAVALAAALAGKIDLAGKTAGVIVSGGNVDASLLSQVISDVH